MADASAPAELTPEQAAATMASRAFLALLVIVSVTGVVVSLAAWAFLQLVYQVTRELYTHLPNAVGYHHGPPRWWSLPVLGIAGLLVAFAIVRLPGEGGHVPAKGLSTGGPAPPVNIPGVLLAGVVGIGFGIVLGPEAPLLALGPGLAVLTIGVVRRDTPPPARMIIAASGAFAAVSFLFASPVIAAVLMIEATGIGGARLPMVIVPGLLSAGIGTLLAIGLDSWTGLPRSNISLGPVHGLPAYAHPTIAQFGWTIVLALLIGIIAHLIMRGGLLTQRVAAPRPFVVLPIVGLAVSGLAIAFSEATGKSVNQVLFSGESALPNLVSQAGTWSISALVLLIVFKGAAYSLSAGSFRGGPTFPAVFLGAAAGLLAARLPGFAVTPAVAVGMGAATAAVLKLPLSAIVLATLLTSTAGTGQEPLIIVGVVVAYLVVLGLTTAEARARAGAEHAASTAPEVGSAQQVPAAPQR